MITTNNNKLMVLLQLSYKLTVERINEQPIGLVDVDLSSFKTLLDASIS